MVSEKSYTRLTLALDIVRKLPSGMHAGKHELNTIKHQISLHDVIAVEPAQRMEIVCDHPQVPLNGTNVCWRVAESLKACGKVAENVRIHIEKHIPVQGGLAGGSANAASVIRLLDRMWNLNLPTEQLCDIGRSVGMDVPFFLLGNTAFDTEATGILEPVLTKLAFDFVLYVPDFGVSTAQAYGSIDYSLIARRLDETRRMRAALTRGEKEAVITAMHNDFESSVFPLHPRLMIMKTELLRAGCCAAYLTGSGSTLVGVARDADHAHDISGRLRGRALVVRSKEN
jgi:4-diphosphocytidyl-2-C-methyl-D-erythritol kinase